MDRILIIYHSLRIGGGEKLVFEIVYFALKNKMRPTVLIVDNFEKGYYYYAFKTLNVPVIRARLTKIHTLRNPLNIITSIYWSLRLKFFPVGFKSIQVLNIGFAEIIRPLVKSSKKINIWHIGNTIQYPDSRLPVSIDLLKNEKDSIIFINNYQEKEIEKQYGPITAKKIMFKLFLNQK